jgi:hypothetical protein
MRAVSIYRIANTEWPGGLSAKQCVYRSANIGRPVDISQDMSGETAFGVVVRLNTKVSRCVPAGQQAVELVAYRGGLGGSNPPPKF